MIHWERGSRSIVFAETPNDISLVEIRRIEFGGESSPHSGAGAPGGKKCLAWVCEWVHHTPGRQSQFEAMRPFFMELWGELEDKHGAPVFVMT
jgi:hypothetical protein